MKPTTSPSYFFHNIRELSEPQNCADIKSTIIFKYENNKNVELSVRKLVL